MSDLSRSDKEKAVVERYTGAANAVENALCCPVQYDQDLLKTLPEEILNKDYGCGDPSAYVQPGEVVLDLGSGAGKICYMAAQLTGSKGRVIGVDMNTAMLDLARKYRDEMAAKMGYANVEFVRGRIQDLKLNMDQVDAFLQENPVTDASGYAAMEAEVERLCKESPMIPDDSVDLILSNCVLNLVRPEDKVQLFQEMYRVLKKGGRVAISDIVADEDVPRHMEEDGELWSGCISGAFREDRFVEAFEAAGFYGVTIDKRDEKPWQVVEGIQFRAVTLLAYKGKEGPCKEHNQAVIYRGPWKSVSDDDGHTLYRGKAMAVCAKTFDIYTKAPYADSIIGLQPETPVDPASAGDFACSGDRVRSPKTLKGEDYNETVAAEGECCEPESCC